MATYITPTVIANAALPTLYNTAVLLPLMNRDYEADFSGKQGDTITIRKPWVPTAPVAFNRSTGIVLEDPAESSTTVVLDTLLDKSFPVTTEDLTLRLTDFQTRLLNPVLEAFAQEIDGRIAEAIVDAAEGAGGGGTVNMTGTSAGDKADGFTNARTILSTNKAPYTERYSVLGVAATGETLKDDLVLQANTSGSTAALRNADVGRLAGFDIFESQNFGVGPNDRGQADGVAFHRSAFVAAIRPLNKPRGIAQENYSVQNYKGLSLRVIYSYDHDAKQDKVTVDIMYGLKAVRPEGVVQLSFGIGS